MNGVLAALIAAMGVMIPCHAMAQAKDPAPLEITADEKMVWDRNAQTLSAFGTVIATQGETTLQSDILEATYSEGDQDNNLQDITATGNVILTMRDSKAYGDKATYDLNTQKAVLTGENLRLETETVTVTAKEAFHYDGNENRVDAIGRANAVQGTDSLSADQLQAYFTDAQSRELDRMVAKGNVVIRTATETLTGDHGVYHTAENTATLNGNVTIQRGANTLAGDRATIDLNTNISQLFGSQSDNNRVKGVFYPEEKK